jgi:RAD51-like protein 2
MGTLSRFRPNNAELGISLHSSQQILSIGPRFPATQSAAALLDSTNDVFHCCPPIDSLLDGGLRRGHVLELLGPPGTPKGVLVLEIIRDFIENREDVLIIGIQSWIPLFVSNWYLSARIRPPEYDPPGRYR